MENRKLSIRDEPNIRLDAQDMSKITCFTGEQRLHVCVQNVPVCTAPRAHMFQHVCAWCRYTKKRFERTHGDVWNLHTGVSACQAASHTDTTTPHTPTTRQDKTRHDTTRHDTTRHDTTRHHNRTMHTHTHTPHQHCTHTPPPHTPNNKTREERRFICSVVVHGLFCWCSDFLVNSVCARDLSLLNSVKFDSI